MAPSGGAGPTNIQFLPTGDREPEEHPAPQQLRVGSEEGPGVKQRTEHVRKSVWCCGSGWHAAEERSAGSGERLQELKDGFRWQRLDRCRKSVPRRGSGADVIHGVSFDDGSNPESSSVV